MRDDELLEKDNEILEKVRNSIIKKNLIVNLYAMKKYLKTKIKPQNGKIKTIFHNNKVLKEGSQCICLSVILIDSYVEKIKTIILIFFRRMYKCCQRKKKMLKFIAANYTSDDSNREKSDQENSDEKN